MAYITTINHQAYRVETDGEDQQHSVQLDGTPLTIDWCHIAPLVADGRGIVHAGGRYSLLIAGKSYEIFARRMTRPTEKGYEVYEVQVAGQRFEVKVEDERTRMLTGLVRGGASTGEAKIYAPMPGLVVGIPFESGTAVSQGQTVVVLEAMKMENDLSSPITGIIKEILVNKGQTVDQGEALIVVVAE